MMDNKQTHSAAKNLDELKSGTWTGSSTTTSFRYRGEAMRRP
jgi:hypothetical protein